MDDLVLLVLLQGPPKRKDVSVLNDFEKNMLNLMYAEHIENERNVNADDDMENLMLSQVSILDDNPIPLKEDLKHIYETKKRRNRKNRNDNPNNTNFVEKDGYNFEDSEILFHKLDNRCKNKPKNNITNRSVVTQNDALENFSVSKNNAFASIFENNQEEVINYISQNNFLDSATEANVEYHEDVDSSKFIKECDDKCIKMKLNNKAFNGNVDKNVLNKKSKLETKIRKPMFESNERTNINLIETDMLNLKIGDSPILLQQNLDSIHENKQTNNIPKSSVDTHNKIVNYGVSKNNAFSSVFEKNQDEIIDYISQSNFFDFAPNTMNKSDNKCNKRKLNNRTLKVTNNKNILKKTKLNTEIKSSFELNKKINLNNQEKLIKENLNLCSNMSSILTSKSPIQNTATETFSEIDLIIDETPEMFNNLLEKSQHPKTDIFSEVGVITDKINETQSQEAETEICNNENHNIPSLDCNRQKNVPSYSKQYKLIYEDVYNDDPILTIENENTFGAVQEIDKDVEIAPINYNNTETTQNFSLKYTNDICFSDNFIQTVFGYSPIKISIDSAIKPVQPIVRKDNEIFSENKQTSLIPLVPQKTKIDDYFTTGKPLKRVKSPNQTNVSKKLKQTNIKITKHSLEYSEDIDSTEKTKLPKFCTPYKSQIDEINQSYDIFDLNNNNCEEILKKLIRAGPIELIFDVIFREGYCQFSKQSKNSTEGTPIGIFIGIFWNINSDSYYYLRNESIGDNCITLRQFFNDILSSKIPCRKICYDTKLLYKYLISKLNVQNFHESNVWDLGLACWLLTPQEPPSSFGGVLGFLELPNAARVMSSDGAFHACNIISTVSKVMEIIKDMLEVKQMWALFEKIENRLPPLLAVMEMRGIKVDRAKLETMGSMMEEKLKICETRAHNEAGRVFQVNSAVQLRIILYHELKLDTKIKQKNANKTKSTCEAMLQQLKGFHPLPGLVLHYRRLHKLKRAHIDGVLKYITPGLNVAAVWDQMASATGRLKSRTPNLQAIPKMKIFIDEDFTEYLYLRESFIARQSYSFLTIDFEQLDFRVATHLVQSVDLLSLIQMPGDLFKNITKRITGKLEVENDQRERTKKIAYSILYGEGPFRLSEILNVDVEEAKCIIASYSKKLPSLAKFAPGIIAKCKNDGFLTTISGRRRYFPNIRSSNYGMRAQSERLALYFVLQGCAADICKSAMLHTDRTLQKHADLRSHLMLQIHEELVWEIHDEDLERTTGLIVNSLSDTGSFCKYLSPIKIPIPFLVIHGKTWASHKSTNN